MFIANIIYLAYVIDFDGLWNWNVNWGVSLKVHEIITNSNYLWFKITNLIIIKITTVLKGKTKLDLWYGIWRQELWAKLKWFYSWKKW